MNRVRVLAPYALTLLAFAASAYAQSLGGDAPDSTKILTFAQWAATLTLLVVDAILLICFLFCCAKLAAAQHKGHAAMALVVCVLVAALLNIGLLYMRSQLSGVTATF